MHHRMQIYNATYFFLLSLWKPENNNKILNAILLTVVWCTSNGWLFLHHQPSERRHERIDNYPLDMKPSHNFYDYFYVFTVGSSHFPVFSASYIHVLLEIHLLQQQTSWWSEWKTSYIQVKQQFIRDGKLRNYTNLFMQANASYIKGMFCCCCCCWRSILMIENKLT